MKKKAFLFVIAVLVLCLTCGMLLVACDKDDDNNNNNNNNNGPTSSLVPAESGEVMTAVITGLDEANKADDGEFAFSLEIVQSDMDAANYGTLFGLAYEKIGDDYFIYAAAGNGNYIKINGAPIGQILDDLFTLLAANVDAFSMQNGYPAISFGDTSISFEPNGLICSLLPTLGESFLFSGAEMSADGAYVLHLDIAKILNSVPEIIGMVAGIIPNVNVPTNASLAQTIEALAGLDEGTIDGYVAQYAGYIFPDQNIGDLDALIDYLAEAVDTIDVKLCFMFSICAVSACLTK